MTHRLGRHLGTDRHPLAGLGVVHRQHVTPVVGDVHGMTERSTSNTTGVMAEKPSALPNASSIVAPGPS